MKRPFITGVTIGKGASGHPATSRILQKIAHQGPFSKPVPVTSTGRRPSAPGKGTLELVSFPGEFLKPCPGTKNYICCGYQILQVGRGCPLNCSYCILQAYFEEPNQAVFINLQANIPKVMAIFDQHPDKIYRIGTGEFVDSLALDPLVGWSEMLPSHFSSRKNVAIEFKTKTTNVEGFRISPYRDRVIVSWSLNSAFVAAQEEHGAPTLRKRLEAAKACQDEGYVVGFHFDPLIEHPHWREDYKKTIGLLDQYIDPKRVIWISLGCLRFVPSLKGIIREKHPGTHILDGEFINGLDGKIRYFKPIRIEMYSVLAEIIQPWYGDQGLYLCMESDDVWKQALGWSPGNSKGLARYLDKRVIHMFGPPFHK
jgi:spore photoproduct lyase